MISLLFSYRKILRPHKKPNRTQILKTYQSTNCTVSKQNPKLFKI